MLVDDSSARRVAQALMEVVEHLHIFDGRIHLVGSLWSGPIFTLRSGVNVYSKEPGHYRLARGHTSKPSGGDHELSSPCHADTPRKAGTRKKR